MSGVSRFISFVIGLIVLILLFILIANRFNANRSTANAGRVTPTVTATPTPVAGADQGGFDFFGLFRRNTPTPSATPTLTFAQQMDSTTGNIDATTTQYEGQNANQIPKTGAPTLVLPLAGAGLALGMWLRKRA